MSVIKFSSVEEYLDGLSKLQREQVLLLRSIILKAEPTLSEHIKWNSPSYVFNGEDRITFNVRLNKPVMIVLHMGATTKEDKKAHPIIADPTNLITWNSNIRGALAFETTAVITENQNQFMQLIKNWLKVSQSVS